MVVVGRSYYYACHKEWLQSIEEEEWFDNDEGLMRARFTTLTKLFVSIESKESLADDRGEIIDRMTATVRVQALLMM